MFFDRFPKDFLWGASTSAHQVEGRNINDWTEFEQRSALSFAKNAENLGFFLDRFAKEAAKKENYISGLSANHIDNYEEDFYLANKIGLGSYRFSIEWSRIEPEEGKFDDKAIRYYKNIIRVLRTYQIEPFVTLWHWTLPVWFVAKGGFKKRKNDHYFLRYVEKIVTEFKDEVNYFITLNEPEIYSMNSYYRGLWPPQKKGLYNFTTVFNNLARIHNDSYKIIKNINSNLQVGIAKNNSYFEIGKDNFRNRTIKKFADYFWNDLFLKKISNHQDFIGLNYYFRNRIDGWFNKNRNPKTSDLGWDLYPQGIYNVLLDLKKYKKPIYITENGLADARDKHREWFLAETVKALAKALGKSVDVKGYFHWSLIDNFEWDKGFWPRFGLVEVDYKTQKRTMRKSGEYYGKIIAAHNRAKNRQSK